ncbi:hypothetical protein N0V90_002145 [Kalmusia sp. IMI 367209]|nr:hypothetical protein N0V90_002145 [Kalmusia sp. IMI 367209]
MVIAIGIDLGTANTRVAVFRHDQCEIIPHEGQSVMPSFVAFTDTGRLVGQAAKSQANINPKNTIFNVLRFIGNNPPFEVTYDGLLPEEKGNFVFRVMYKGVETAFTPVAILAMILKRAKKDAENFLGQSIANAVITIPCSFNLSQRYAIKDAALIAGIHALRLIHAPTVAFADLVVTQKMPAGERNVLMCDIGAGHYNVVLATLEEGIQDIKAVVGAEEICVGVDFDKMLMRHMVDTFGLKHKISNMDEVYKDIRRSPRALRRLRTACEEAKHQLASTKEALVEIEQFLNGKDLNGRISRALFEKPSIDLVRPLLEPIERVLHDAKIEKGQVHDIVLIGGSSRISVIQKTITDFFNGKEPLRCLNLEETSARGAAIHAAILSGDQTSKCTNELLLCDVVSQSLGIETAGGIMTPIITRNTSIPTKKSESYGTYQDDQQIFSASFFEGDHARTEHCMRLGHVQMSIPPAPRNTQEIGVTFDIDANYMINVDILAKSTGKRQKIRLDGLTDKGFERLNEFQLEELIVGEERMEADDDVEQARIEARNTLEELLYRIKDWTGTIALGERTSGVNRLEGLADSIFTWMDTNPSGPASEFETRTEHLRKFQKSVAIEQVTHHKLQTQQKVERNVAHPLRHDENIDNLAVSSSDTRQEVEKRPGSESRISQESHDQKLPLPIKDPAMRESTANRADEEDMLLGTLKSTPTTIEDQPKNNVHLATKYEEKKNGRQVVESMVEHDSQGDLNRRIDRGDESRDPIQSMVHPASPPSSAPSSSTTKLLARDGPERSDTPRTANRGLTSLFNKPTDSSLTYTDTEFIQISTYLRNTGQPDWSKIPRLYTVLRLINQLDMLDVFIQQGITDIWFPFSQTTLPHVLSPSTKANFLKHQESVLSKSLLFEKSPGRRHTRFLQGEPLPYEVVGKLGAGAHGQVDKVMSTVSHREYARKLFQRVRGMRKDAINSFLTELQVLKRIQHYHCIELVQSYTDPKFFALIMSPVGDCNLLDYYSIALKDVDKSSLLRSFFGCLANALQYIHSIRIRHRDIKPHNILVRGDRVFLTDFGIALDWEELSRSTTTADSGKTLLYAAPEVVRYEKRNTSADIWSLGCVFIEMATILKGRPIRAMRAFFEEESGNYRFYANITRITSWIDSCRQTGLEKDDVIFDWALLMLEEQPGKRPTAASLHHDINVECARQGVPFCGACCQEAGESSGIEDESGDEAWDMAPEEFTVTPGDVDRASIVEQ